MYIPGASEGILVWSEVRCARGGVVAKLKILQFGAQISVCYWFTGYLGQKVVLSIP